MQSYKNKEIIVVDDQSTDNSLNLLKKFKSRIILLTNKKKKFNIGSYNQINAYKIGLKKSKGEIICFLDSDDFFARNKLKEVVNYFINNHKDDIILDLPIIFFNKKKKFKLIKKERKTLFIPWPRFSPQSCISIRRSYLLKIYDKISIKKYPNVWLDFRIIILFFIQTKNLKKINKFLTYYQQSKNSVTNNYKLFSKNWWIRRKECYDYFDYVSGKINKKKWFSLDFFVTKFINFFLKI
jgi:glycosyltransferase involved in cell wall biosynthesis